MTQPTILSIDQGTTSTRAILFSQRGKIIAKAQKELPNIYPHAGWVEQDALVIWRDTLSLCRAIMKKRPGAADKIAAIGITNQRETTILWDRNTGAPVYNAIVWQDRRTANFCRNLHRTGHENTIRSRTGLLLDPYFSATKIAWLLDNIKGLRRRADRGDIAFGTVDSWLLWNLTRGKVHATDVTNAARTMLFNIRTNDWDDSLLRLFNVPRALLPTVKDNAADYGAADAKWFGRPIVVGGMAGDQQAAMVGQACFATGMVKATYGTGCFALVNIGEKFKTSKNRLITTPAYRLQGKTTYAIEGSIFVAGAAIQWLRDEMGFFNAARDSEKIARQVSDSHGVYFVPAFTGLGAPYWDADARAAIFGLTRDTSRAHIIRAALEAQAYQTRDLVDAMRKDTGRRAVTIRADGGLAANHFACQFIADILGIELEIPRVLETTALGAAYLAGLQAGIYHGLDEVNANWARAEIFRPDMSAARRKIFYTGWQAAVQTLISKT